MSSPVDQNAQLQLDALDRESERDLIPERTDAGLAARARGRKTLMTLQKIRAAKSLLAHGEELLAHIAQQGQKN